MGAEVPAEEVTSFPPLADVNVRVLVLGSMPGIASLQAVQYYAHPRNVFWRLMEHLFGIPSDANYSSRLEQLLGQGIGLWDVLQHCRRVGSLDSNIRGNSEIPNDFGGFLARHPHIHSIYFNGRKAEQVFHRKALPLILQLHPQLANRLSQITLTGLPSTSPAMASLDFSAKLERWQHLAVSLNPKRDSPSANEKIAPTS